MKSKKFLISALIFIVLAVGIIAGVYLVQNNQDIREKAAPATNLSFSPSSLTKNPGQTFELIINANTGENKITGVDIEVSFDPSIIQFTEMASLSAITPLSTVIKNGVIDNTAGTARYAAFTINRDDAVFGNLDIIRLAGTVLNTATNGSSQIDFSAMTAITAVDEGVNVIINESPATITVSSGAIGVTATATPSPTPAGGIGGAGVTLPTATPTRTATPRPTSTSIVTTTLPMVTLPPDVPETGISLPLIASLVLGLGAIIFSLTLAF